VFPNNSLPKNQQILQHILQQIWHAAPNIDIILSPFCTSIVIPPDPSPNGQIRFATDVILGDVVFAKMIQ
jgi:hypothetical protein